MFVSVEATSDAGLVFSFPGVHPFSLAVRAFVLGGAPAASEIAFAITLKADSVPNSVSGTNLLPKALLVSVVHYSGRVFGNQEGF